ncbi:MAG: rhodanese-like domain-containing protein [Lentimonas sp.]
MNIQTIPASKLPELVTEGVHVIDVRTPAEFKSVHVIGAELHPLETFNAAEFCQQHGTEKPIYILCHSGKRAEMAAQKLITAGHQATYVVDGGTQAAIAAGVSLVQGRKTMSIERQVRIAAGGLVFVGTLLGLQVHMGFFAMPAFVGAGLALAGITDTCGMGMMLSKMPWNQ